MKYKEIISNIDDLKAKIEASELTTEVKKKINYKFRLDWNYYSNSMEGNTLTMDETRSVMVGNLSVNGKPLKDVLEIKGHDVVITEILKIGKGEVRLSEKRIKEIHKAIMHEDAPDEVEKIGEWKKINNYVINYKGERYDFVEPDYIIERMHNLLNETNAEIDAVYSNKKSAKHPIEIALNFHLEYVSIHPFYDGNGRTARILTNLILISFGYPPFWVKEDERKIYNQYLGDIQCYGGSSDLFYGLVAQLLLRSQQIVIDAMEGKDIEEKDDLDKKIRLLEVELSAVDSDNEVKMKFNKEVLLNIYDTWFSKLFIQSAIVIQKFNKFFTGTKHYLSVDNAFGSIGFVNENPQYLLNQLKENGLDKYNNDFRLDNFSLIINTFYGTFIKGGLDTFGCNYSISIYIENEIGYTVIVDEFNTENNGNRKRVEKVKKLLHQPLTDEEIKDIVNTLGTTILNHIDFKTKEIGLRK